MAFPTSRKDLPKARTVKNYDRRDQVTRVVPIIARLMIERALQNRTISCLELCRTLDHEHSIVVSPPWLERPLEWITDAIAEHAMRTKQAIPPLAAVISDRAFTIGGDNFTVLVRKYFNLSMIDGACVEIDDLFAHVLYDVHRYSINWLPIAVLLGCDIQGLESFAGEHPALSVVTPKGMPPVCAPIVDQLSTSTVINDRFGKIGPVATDVPLPNGDAVDAIFNKEDAQVVATIRFNGTGEYELARAAMAAARRRDAVQALQAADRPPVQGVLMTPFEASSFLTRLTGALGIQHVVVGIGRAHGLSRSTPAVT